MQLCPKCSSMPTWFDGKGGKYYCNNCGATYKAIANPVPAPVQATSVVSVQSANQTLPVQQPQQLASTDKAQAEVQKELQADPSTCKNVKTD